MEVTVTKPTKRLGILDAARGYVLLNMLGYHLCYDLVVLFGIKADWFFDWQGYVWQRFICCGFIFLAGISSCFSRNNVKRGITLFMWGMALTLGTLLVMPDQIVLFGILHFLGCAALLWELLRPWLEKLPATAGLIGFLLLFLIANGVQWGYLGVWRFPLYQLPNSFYSIPWLFPLGFPQPSFFSSDYFPVIPWFFLFLMGTYFYRFMLQSPRLIRMLEPEIPLLGKLGRHTLMVYLLHQPVLYCLVWLGVQLI